MRMAYAVPGETERVEIGVYDIAGRQVKILTAGVQSAGHHDVAWDGRNESGAHVGNGVYFVRIQVGNQARLVRLMEMQNRISCEINATYIGKTLEVLVEGPSPKNPDVLQGFSREFKMVHFQGPAELRGKTVQVRATDSHLWGLSAKMRRGTCLRFPSQFSVSRLRT